MRRSDSYDRWSNKNVRPPKKYVFQQQIRRRNKAGINVEIVACSDGQSLAARDETMEFIRRNFFAAGFGATPDNARIVGTMRAIAPITHQTHQITIHIGSVQLFDAVLNLGEDRVAIEVGKFLCWEIPQWRTAVFESEHYIYLAIAAVWRSVR